MTNLARRRTKIPSKKLLRFGVRGKGFGNLGRFGVTFVEEHAVAKSDRAARRDRVRSVLVLPDKVAQPKRIGRTESVGSGVPSSGIAET